MLKYNLSFKCVDLEAEISEKMEKLGDVWQCKDCLWETKYKTRLWEHVEAKHVQYSGYLLFQVLLIKETA